MKESVPPAAGALNKGRARLDFAWPIDLRLTVAGHGWAHLEPWRWDPEAGRLSRAERFADETGVVAVHQSDLRSVAIEWEGTGAAAMPAVLQRVRRWLSAEWDPTAAIAALLTDLADEAALIERGGGRLLRGSSFYEDFVKTVLTINTSWSSTCRMTAALVAEPGGGVFPGPEEVLGYGEGRLRERAKLGFRAPTLIGATDRMLRDGVIDAAGCGDPDRLDHDYLTSLKGIGPYAAAHCRMLLHDFARIPVDSEVLAYLRRQHDAIGAAEFVAGRGNGPYVALGYKLTRLREKPGGGKGAVE
ncbi:MAG: hypothetical protein JO038_05875 [Alphaproteobacteria bacterium]|nr:hypothetical protein [Alphaproteobacteria bacterium]